MQLTNVILLAIATLVTACSTTTAPQRLWSGSGSGFTHADQRPDRPDHTSHRG